MDKLLLENEKLYESTRQFLEYCSTSNSANAEIYEFYTELAANKGISFDILQYDLSLLDRKVKSLQNVLLKLSSLTQKVEISSSRFFSSDYEDIALFRFDLDLMQTYISYNQKFCKLGIDITKDYWDYLRPDAKEQLKDVAYNLLQSRNAYLEGWGITSFRRFTLVAKQLDKSDPLYKFSLSAAKCDTAILRFTDTILNAVGYADPDESLYNAQVMQQFLDLLTKDALADRSKLIPYTEEMSQKARKLISGVEVDE